MADLSMSFDPSDMTSKIATNSDAASSALGEVATVSNAASAATAKVSDASSKIDNWLDQSVKQAATPTLAGLIVADGGTIQCVGAPVLTFNDTDDILGITGCKVHIGGSVTGPTLYCYRADEATPFRFDLDRASATNFLINNPNIAAGAVLQLLLGLEDAGGTAKIDAVKFVAGKIDNTADSLDSYLDIYTMKDGVSQNAVRINNNNNIGLAQTSFGTNATKTFAQATGVAPTTSPADCFQMYSADFNAVAGKACPHFRIEDGSIIRLNQNTIGPSITFTALSNEPPAANFATLDTRNSIPVLDFDADADESAEFSGVMPRSYGGGGVTVTIGWMATDTTVTPHNVVWNAAFKSVTDDADDLDTKAYAAVNTVTDAEASASGEVAYSVITFTDGADMDSVAAGEYFRLIITRDADNGADTLTDDAELVFVEIRET